MNYTEFCYWLMGTMEMHGTSCGLNKEQTQILKNHLDMCFEHIVNVDGSLKEEKHLLDSGIMLFHQTNKREIK